MALKQHLRRRMLQHGLLPAQLPPLFCSDSLAASVDDIDRDLTVRSDGNGKTWTEPVRFSSARPAGFRRRLAIPNPYSYVRIVDEIADELADHRSMVSRSDSMVWARRTTS